MLPQPPFFHTHVTQDEKNLFQIGTIDPRFTYEKRLYRIRQKYQDPQCITDDQVGEVVE